MEQMKQNRKISEEWLDPNKPIEAVLSDAANRNSRDWMIGVIQYRLLQQHSNEQSKIQQAMLNKTKWLVWGTWILAVSSIVVPLLIKLWG